jgi:hypothetical protein
MFTVDSRPIPRRKVRCSCGHEYFFRIGGRTAKRREETMLWLAGFPCPDCERKTKADKHDKQA